MRSYNQALSHHTLIDKPPRAAFWRYQTIDDARPLDRVAYRHKGIHKTEDNVVYYRHHNTNIATFIPNLLKPDTYTVVIKFHNSTTTRKFMADYNLHYSYLRAENNRHVRIPYQHYMGRCASAVLTFDSIRGTLITDPQYSWHPTVATKVTSPEDRAYRKLVVERMEPYKTLTMFNLDRLLEFARDNAKDEYGLPFFSISDVYSDRNPLYALGNYQGVVRRWAGSNRHTAGYDTYPFDSETAVELFMNAMPSLMTMYISRKANAIYDAHNEGLRWGDVNHLLWDCARDKAIERFDMDDFAKAIDRQVIRSFGLDEGTGIKLHPLFRDKLPSRCFFPSSGEGALMPDHLMSKIQHNLFRYLRGVVITPFTLYNY